MITIPHWVVSIFAVFGFVCAWCIGAAAVGVWLSFLLHEVDK